jgi:hypothetical protein
MQQCMPKYRMWHSDTRVWICHCHSACMYRSGTQKLNSEVELRSGTQKWNSEVELRSGTQKWNSEVELRSGTHWEVDLRTGTQNWNSALEIRTGTQNCNSKLQLRRVWTGCNIGTSRKKWSRLRSRYFNLAKQLHKSKTLFLLCCLMKIYYWSKWKRRIYSKYNRYQKCCVCKL